MEPNQTDIVRDVAERAWQRRLQRDPYLQLRRGVAVTWLPRGTLEEAEQEASFARSLLVELAGVDAKSLPYADALTLEFLRDYLQRQIESPESWWSQFPVTPYCSRVLSFYCQMIFRPFSFHGQADVDRYLSLMRDYAALVRALLDKLKAQAQRGWRVPKPALPGAVATLSGVKTAAPTCFAITPEKVRELEAAAASALVRTTQQVLTREVLPAFDSVLEYLDGPYRVLAPDAVGIGHFPGGFAAYARLLLHHVTFEITAERVHEVGLEQVSLLTQRMSEVRQKVGFQGSEEEFHKHLHASGRLHAKSTAEVEQRFRTCLRRIEPLLRQYFATLPKAVCDVARLEPALEAGMSYGYYQLPNSANPVGKYYYNGSGLDTRCQLTLPAILYHELLPGHHFHLARQTENTDLPLIRRETLDITSYVEGWAEYASGLAGEMGLYDDPYDLYGRLIHERFTAQRLVTDTGLNVLGWTLDKAQAYMRRNTMESETQIATETLRYSTDIPGQALAYRLGFLKMMELRETAQRELGGGFDIRDFHEAVLGPGALPLNLLQQHIMHFVAKMKSTPASAARGEG